ncbi:MAG: sensor histidine kinase [Verrucomicrobiota bacterium]
MTVFRTIFMLAPAIFGVAAAVPMDGAAEPITRVAVLRGLPREGAAKALAVKLTGVVTYMGWENFVMHDGDASVFVDFHFSRAKGYWQGAVPDLTSLEPGAGVEVEGVTDPGGFSPMVLVTKFRRIGAQMMPPPRHPPIERLLAGAEDTQWVEVEGVVKKSDTSGKGPDCLTLVVHGHPCPVVMRTRLKRSNGQLVDARVRVRGVVLNLANLRSQVAGLKIHSNGDQDIDILIPPPTDPFQAPRVALSRLIPFAPDADLDHRKVSSGVATFVVPGRFFYLLGDGACVRVEPADPAIKPGDWVEVAGFIDTTRILAAFSGALVRVVGKGQVPSPDQPQIAEILNPKVRSWEEMVAEPGHSDSNGRLIRLVGVLRRVMPRDKEAKVTLVIESGKDLVQVLLPVADEQTARAVAQWVEGSVVEVTGVCELEMVRLDELPWFSIAGFHLWLSSPRDLRVVSTPPWWTPQRMALILTVVLLVLALALVWGYAMRRQVARRSGELAEEIAARGAATLEFDAILGERRRLANDLHDTLEQALTGLALQLEITERAMGSDPGLSARHLHLAQQFLERSRREVHRTVWDLRAHGLDGRDFLDVLHERVADMVEGSAVGITVDREGTAFALPDLLAGNLLLLAQEAVTNALKHAAPGKIEIRLKFSDAAVELSVKDDGRGFDRLTAPGQYDGHFGLQGMHERVKRLAGWLAIHSISGQGTLITVRVPLPDDPPHAGT